MPHPSSSPSAGLTLATVPKGASAVIVSLREGLSAALAEHVHRLAELGFLPGERVQVVASGIPSGDPIAVRIGRATFALRRFEAELVSVTTTHDDTVSP